LVLVGAILVAIALLLKKRLISTDADASASQGPSPDN